MRADSVWIDRKSSLSVRRAISASAPASSTPVGPPPMMTKVSSRRLGRGVGFTLGGFEREQNPAPDFQRIVQRLETGRARRPFRVAEIGVRGAGRDDEVVVVDAAAVDDHPAASRRGSIVCASASSTCTF